MRTYFRQQTTSAPNIQNVQSGKRPRLINLTLSVFPLNLQLPRVMCEVSYVNTEVEHTYHFLSHELRPNGIHLVQHTELAAFVPP